MGACDAAFEQCCDAVRADPEKFCANPARIERCCTRVACKDKKPEDCKKGCNEVPRCLITYEWDIAFNNSCFGGPDDEPHKAHNGVCNDGGPGAMSHECAFGTPLRRL
jgi:hypothetical protein